jgi:hypothetical protein
MALGQQVLVVHNGQAYQTVIGDVAAGSPFPGTSEAEQYTGSELPKGTEEGATTEPKTEIAPEPGAAVCSSLLAFPGLLALGMIVARYGRKKE